MTDNKRDETIQPTDLAYVTKAEFTAGLNRVTDHIDTKFKAFHDEVTTQADALDLRVNGLENSREASKQLHSRLEARIEVVLTKLEHINDLHTRFNELTKRVNTIDDDLDDNVKAHVNDIEQRSALTMEAVNNMRSSMTEMRNEMRGVNAQMNAQAQAHKSSIDVLTKSLAPQIEWIEQRRVLEQRVVKFINSKLGMVLLTAFATILLGNNGLQLIDLIFGGS